jgi:hypothetical protein
MYNRFIWNIDQDRIHFVNDFNFEKPLEDNYITGEYFDADKSITLYSNDVKVPINLDYFISLWKASEPDKEILRERVEVMERKESRFVKKAGANNAEVKLLSAYAQTQGPVALINLTKFLEYDPSAEDARRFFTPILADYNTVTLEKLIPETFPKTKQEWQSLSEEEVFRYVEAFVNNMTSDNSQSQQLINQLMDKWNQTGFPIDPKDYVIDESLVDWQKMINLIKVQVGQYNTGMGFSSKWKKKSDYNGWTNWETWNTKLIMDNEYNLYQHFRQMIANGDSFEEFVNHAIEMVVGPYNQDLLEDFQSMTDEEEVDMMKQNDLDQWRSDAARRYPEDPDAQEKYVEKMKRIIYGIMGNPEPTDIANHWLDESKVNWEEIYESMKRDWQEEQEYNRKNSKWKIRRR